MRSRNLKNTINNVIGVFRNLARMTRPSQFDISFMGGQKYYLKSLHNYSIVVIMFFQNGQENPPLSMFVRSLDWKMETDSENKCG